MYSIVTLTYDVHSHLCTTFAYLPISNHAHNIIIHGHSCILYSCPMYMVIHVLPTFVYTELLKTNCINTFKSIPYINTLHGPVYIELCYINWLMQHYWQFYVQKYSCDVWTNTISLTQCDPWSLTYSHIVVILAITITPFTR